MSMSKYGPKPKTLMEIFLSGVEKTDNCWFWKKSKRIGYGQIGHRENGRLVNRSAHRVSYELFKGPIPKDMFVCHSCDNPCCVNPEHLWIGTPKDNNRDCLAKGRHPNYWHGGGGPPKKLTESKVSEIKQLLMAGTSKLDIAQAYGVTKSLICNISSGKVWKRVIGDHKEMQKTWSDNRKNCGENANRSKLKTSDALEIINLYSQGIVLKEIGLRYGVSQSAIFNVIHGKTKYVSVDQKSPMDWTVCPK